MKHNVLSIEKIIEYYDVPQLFIGRDRFDTQYMCLLYEDTPTCRYTAIRISNNRYHEFYLGKLDLRTLFLNPEDKGEYYNVECYGDDYLLDVQPLTSISEDRLPAENFYCDTTETEIHKVSVPKQERSFFERLIKRHGWVAM